MNRDVVEKDPSLRCGETKLNEDNQLLIAMEIKKFYRENVDFPGKSGERKLTFMIRK